MAGTFEGYGSIFGNIDAGGDVVLAGAFRDSLAAFRKAGVILWSHDNARPVANVREAREDARGLFIRGEFFSTPDAQMARTILTERHAAGQTWGLSIGYVVEKSSPMGGSIGRALRALEKVRLLEVSLVALPMNDEARVTAVKLAPTEDARWRAMTLDEQRREIHVQAIRLGVPVAA